MRLLHYCQSIQRQSECQKLQMCLRQRPMVTLETPVHRCFDSRADYAVKKERRDEHNNQQAGGCAGEPDCCTPGAASITVGSYSWISHTKIRRRSEREWSRGDSPFY